MDRFEYEHTCWDPKDGELCLSRVKPEETLVEARSDTDVQKKKKVLRFSASHSFSFKKKASHFFIKKKVAISTNCWKIFKEYLQSTQKNRMKKKGFFF